MVAASPPRGFLRAGFLRELAQSFPRFRGLVAFVVSSRQKTLAFSPALIQTPDMEKEVIAALEKQAAHELYAAHSYLAMAYWSDLRHYAGFASFFHLQAQEEREHAAKLLQFLADRDVLPTIGVINSPRNTFNNLADIAKTVYDLERANTAGIHAAYEAALGAKDYATQVMLHWFIQEQVEEEAWSDKLVVKVQEAGCSGGMTMLDRHLVRELRGDSAA